MFLYYVYDNLVEIKMKEKEKMLAGMLYDANNDENLLKERLLFLF